MKRFFAYSAVVTALIGLLIVRSVEGGTFLHNPTDSESGVSAADLAAATAYRGPFAVTVKPGTVDELMVGDGFFYAGKYAIADWPDTYSTNSTQDFANLVTVPFAIADGTNGLGAMGQDGTYFVVASVAVDEDTGYFSTNWALPHGPALHPAITYVLRATPTDPVPYAPDTVIQLEAAVRIILATVTVAGDRITSIRQDHHSHIYVPVHRDLDGNYKASLYGSAYVP